MSRKDVILFLCSCLLIAGCSNESVGVATSTGEDVNSTVATGAESSAEASEKDPAIVSDGVVALSPANTEIQFIGTHTGDDPNPRTGVFTEFSGQAEIDPASNTLQSVNVEIQTDSLATPIERLTNHLKSPDFFDTREYPTARFESTEIAPGDASDKVMITGNLTLMETIKELRFPAEVTVNEEGLKLTGELTIDRAEFGMGGLQDRVNKEVEIKVKVGQATQPPATGEGPGGGRGRGGRGGFDSAAIFERRDANSDGKLTEDEFSERMRENFAEIDSDGDGAVTLEEFQERMRQFRGRRGRPGEAGAEDRPPRPQRPESE